MVPLGNENGVAMSESSIESAIVEVSNLRPALVSCGFALGPIEIELGPSPCIIVSVERSADSVRSVDQLRDHSGLTDKQHALVSGIQRALSLEGAIRRTGHKLAKLRIKLDATASITAILSPCAEGTQTEVSIRDAGIGEGATILEDTAPDRVLTFATAEATPTGPTLPAPSSAKGSKQTIALANMNEALDHVGHRPSTDPRPDVPPEMPADTPRAEPTPSTVDLAPGTAVFVLWSDGNRYPGRVVNAASGQYLIQFENGSNQWIASQHVSVAG